MLWLDGILHEGNVVPFDLADRGLLLGDGVFDTSLVLGGRMVWRDAHVARLVVSCQAIGFTVGVERIEAAIDALLARTTQGVMRITITRGSAPRGLAPPKDPRPLVLATIAPLRRDVMFAPLSLHVTAIRRNDTSPTARIKSLNYLDGVLATREAIGAGCDDALFLCTREKLACSTVGNVLLLFGDQLVTPPLADGVIAGTVRGFILATCDELGLESVERSMSLADLDRADAVIVTNSLRLVAPVMSVGRRELGSSGRRRVQTIVAHVAAAVRDQTGVDPRVLANV